MTDGYKKVICVEDQVSWGDRQTFVVSRQVADKGYSPGVSESKLSKTERVEQHNAGRHVPYYIQYRRLLCMNQLTQSSPLTYQ